RTDGAGRHFAAGSQRTCGSARRRQRRRIRAPDRAGPERPVVRSARGAAGRAAGGSRFAGRESARGVRSIASHGRAAAGGFEPAARVPARVVRAVACRGGAAGHRCRRDNAHRSNPEAVRAEIDARAEEEHEAAIVSAEPSPRGGIHILQPEVAARIAAGEVIERPVSVVRELLDNAIDAGATRISVEIEEGGLSLIRVTDDGRGIPPEEVELAFERHATSKIADLSELAAVRTLGFRGEALPSIAAAGDVEVITRAASEPVGVHAVLVEARVVRRNARPAPQGTSFTVRDLFARLP